MISFLIKSARLAKRPAPPSIYLNRFASLRYYQKGIVYKRFNDNGYRKNQNIFDLLANPITRKYLAITAGVGLVVYVTNLEPAPVSGRNRFIWIPRSLELKVGNYSYRSVLSDNNGKILPENHPMTRRVEKVFDRIIEAAYRDPTVDESLMDGIKWQIHVVDDPTAPPNAFVLPGGKVFVFSSILPICKNDDGLATVLSHEFAHQLARHSAENLSKAPLYSALGLVLYTITGTEGINRLLLDGVVKMPASRQMETEADYIGLMIMSKACFNPDEAVRLWQRMAEFEKSQKNRVNGMLEFLSTHPASDKRIQNMNEWMSKAQELYSQSNCGTLDGYYKGFQNSFLGNSPAGSIFGS